MTETAFSHDPDDREELSFTYDAVGNRTSMRHGAVETRYGYDNADQLLEVVTRGRRTAVGQGRKLPV